MPNERIGNGEDERNNMWSGFFVAVRSDLDSSFPFLLSFHLLAKNGDGEEPLPSPSLCNPRPYAICCGARKGKGEIVR